MATAKPYNSQPYRIRESAKAKHVSIKVSHLGEVEVVLPKGFDRRKLPEILAKRQDWIAKTTQRIVAERQSFGAETETDPTVELPVQLMLRSISEEWTLHYQPQTAWRLITAAPCQLTVQGEIDHHLACYRLLKHWLIRKAEVHLIPWLRQVSQEVELPCQKIAVRGQKTIWASCSSKKNISLNYKLLFLPPELVRYVFIHELCHTAHLNHSDRFWAFVADKEPDYLLHDLELNKGWCYIPPWIERSAD
jgi:predicted metal-dependent hydrolase